MGEEIMLEGFRQPGDPGDDDDVEFGSVAVVCFQRLPKMENESQGNKNRVFRHNFS